MKKFMQYSIILLTVVYMSFFLACLNEWVGEFYLFELGLSTIWGAFLVVFFLLTAYLILKKITVVKWIILISFLLMLSTKVYSDIVLLKDFTDGILCIAMSMVFLVQVFFGKEKKNDEPVIKSK